MIFPLAAWHCVMTEVRLRVLSWFPRAWEVIAFIQPCPCGLQWVKIFFFLVISIKTILCTHSCRCCSHHLPATFHIAWLEPPPHTHCFSGDLGLSPAQLESLELRWQSAYFFFYLAMTVMVPVGQVCTPVFSVSKWNWISLRPWLCPDFENSPFWVNLYFFLNSHFCTLFLPSLVLFSFTHPSFPFTVM